ncbi:MAG: hypothetical protein OXG81_09420 [Acidobacteria bacterium]|nr:hypothetical protein [Acidobacteriota bacterium]
MHGEKVLSSSIRVDGWRSLAGAQRPGSTPLRSAVRPSATLQGRP